MIRLGTLTNKCKHVQHSMLICISGCVKLVSFIEGLVVHSLNLKGPWAQTSDIVIAIHKDAPTRCYQEKWFKAATIDQNATTIDKIDQ